MKLIKVLYNKETAYYTIKELKAILYFAVQHNIDSEVIIEIEDKYYPVFSTFTASMYERRNFRRFIKNIEKYVTGYDDIDELKKDSAEYIVNSMIADDLHFEEEFNKQLIESAERERGIESE